MNAEFIQADKKAVAAMFGDIRASFRDTLETNSWMDPDTKEEAIVKLDEIEAKVGYPNFALDNIALDRYYDEVAF